jgi:hypothetical protein
MNKLVKILAASLLVLVAVNAGAMEEGKGMKGQMPGFSE